MGRGHGRVDLLLQGLKATLFELELLLQVNHLSLQLVDLGDRKPSAHGTSKRLTVNCRRLSPQRGTQSAPAACIMTQVNVTWATLFTTPCPH